MLFFFFLVTAFFPIQTVSYCTVLKQLLLNINTFWHFKSATCIELSAAPKQLFFKLNAEKSNHCVHSSSSHVKFVVLLFLLNLSYARSFAVPLLPTFVIPWLSMAAEPSVPFSNQPAHPHPRSKRWRTMVAVRFFGWMFSDPILGWRYPPQYLCFWIYCMMPFNISSSPLQLILNCLYTGPNIEFDKKTGWIWVYNNATE